MSSRLQAAVDQLRDGDFVGAARAMEGFIAELDALAESGGVPRDAVHRIRQGAVRVVAGLRECNDAAGALLAEAMSEGGSWPSSPALTDGDLPHVDSGGPDGQRAAGPPSRRS